MIMATDSTDPVLQDAKSCHLLSGLSGALVYLLTVDGENWFVRKAAATAESSVRLKAQAHKQECFADQIPSIRVPRVLGHGERDGRFFFDMEFVRAMDGATYLRRATYGQVADLTNRLCAYLRSAAVGEPFRQTEPVSIFETLFAKVCEVERRTSAMGDATLGRVLYSLDSVRSAGAVTPTICHGDLTLENLMVDSAGDLWMFDLLDSPIEHYWQDVAKLHQDLTGGWYLRNDTRISSGVLGYVSRRVIEEANMLDSTYRFVHRALVTASFVRILPYARTPDETQFVLDRILYLTSDLFLEV